MSSGITVNGATITVAITSAGVVGIRTVGKNEGGTPVITTLTMDKKQALALADGLNRFAGVLP